MWNRSRAAGLLACGLLALGCGASWRPPPPPSVWPVAPLATAQHVGTDASSASQPEDRPAAHGTDATTTTPRSAEPTAAIEIEQAYKLGERAVPTDSAAYEADILERRRWNDGGWGATLREPPPPEGHPDPRVIVNIVEVRGPHQAKAIERHARRRHWLPVIRCYRLGAYKDPHLRGWTRGRIRLSSAGKVYRPRLVRTELADRAVARCMVERLADLRFHHARGASEVIVDMRVGPGDDPLPPPEDQMQPGEGTVAIEAMMDGVRAGLPAIEQCYRAAFAYAPELWGRLVIRFHLTERGELDEAFETESRFPDARVKQCILREARKLRFARPKKGDIRFVVPLRLFSDRAPVATSRGD